MADGLSIDTSSYPKAAPVPPMDPLGTLGKVVDIQRGQQALQSGGLTIDKQKLDLVNQRYGEFVKTLTGLRNDPNLNEDMLRNWAQTQVKLGYVTPEMAGTFISQLPPTQGLPHDKAKGLLVNNIDNNLTHAATLKEALDYHSGQQGTVDVGNAVQPVAVSPKFGMLSTGLPIQKQLPTGTPGFNQEGQPAFAPPNPNAVAMPPPAPGSNVPLPIARPQTAPATFNERAEAAFPHAANPPAGKPSSFAPQPPPLFKEGAAGLTEDQGLALARATAMKPAEEAFKFLPGLRSGPTTEAFTKAVAALKANGIIPTDAENDPTAIRQIVNKKLAQYVQGSPIGQRSDAAQALTEASSPNANTQINPALIRLTRDALALDRVQIARPNAFTDANGNQRKDLQNYGQHRATFPQSIDERAFGLDYLDAKERQDLVKKMIAKYQKNPNDPEAKKFLLSYDIAKKQGFVGSSEE